MSDYDVIARFEVELRAFTSAHACTLTFSNAHAVPALLWEAYDALSSRGSSAERRSFAGHPSVALELTTRDDGLITYSVQIGNYGPPETRCTYGLRIADLACVDVCDDVDFDLVTTEIHFRVRARTADALENVVAILVGRHAARGAALLARIA